ncbi:hypothetical protein [Telmatospirillum sp.]|uniref:hypothetical protein n=1 Tax=Telmatospirillum sp. TaxID=2079197 RepID=UPI0028513212|nr:hypothetical protein [Telmatospirillum sp.]MDR3440950.1 hypothetical protein [Telmatospirillum sp.]
MAVAEDASNLRVAWRRYWLQQIHDFSDANLQRREWLNPKQTNPHWSYIEFMCSYFSGFCLSEGGYAKAVTDNLVTEEEAVIVARLHKLLEKHDAPNGNHYDNNAVFDDPASERVNDFRTGSALSLSPIF